MKRWEISAGQAAFLLAGATALTGHALAVTYFFEAGGRDAWMGGILALPAGGLALAAIDRLGKWFPGQTVVEYLPRILGHAGYILAILFPIYYFAALIFTLRMTTDWMVDSILPDTPSWVMGLVYAAGVVYAAGLGLDALARINQLVLPLLTVFGFLVSSGTLPAKDYRLLTPFFENGVGPVLAVTSLVVGSLGEMSIMAMAGAFVPRTQQRHLLRYYLLALLYIVMTISGPAAGSTATLGYRVAQNMPYPTFQHWLMVSIARFFERTDLLAVHQWLAGAFVRSALYLLMGVHGCCQLAGRGQWTLKVVPFAAGVMLLLAEVLLPTKLAFDQYIRYVYLPAGAFIGIAIPPVLVLVAWLRGLHRQQQGTNAYGG